jgi:PAS domain S-box-containing protein
MGLNTKPRRVRYRLLREYAVAILAVSLAFAARLGLDSVLGDRLPLQFFYISTLIAASYGGFGPGLISVLLGFLLADWFFMSPRQTLGLSGFADVTQVAAYLIVGLAISAIGQLMRVKERRVRAEEAAQTRAHKRIAVTLESITDCFYSLDREWCYSYINAPAEKFFGIPKENMLGQSVWKPFPQKLFSQSEGSEFEVQFRKAMAEQKPVAFEIFSSADERWLEVHAYPSPESLSVFFRDITPRKQVEQALREERRILDLAHVFVCDLDHRIVLWNEGAHKLYGWTKEAAVGRIAHELLQTEFPEPFDEIKGILLTQGHWKGELVHQTHAGQRIIVATQWELHRDAEGQPAAILEVNDDITERKRAENHIQALNAQLQRRVEEFQTLINTAPIGIAVATDPDCNCIWANPEFSRILGTKLHQNISTSGPEAGSLPFKMLRGAQELPPEQLPMQRACREGAEVLDEEQQIERADGSVIHALCRATPLRYEDGKVRGCIGVFLDITERKRAEEELRSSEERFRRVVEGAPSAMIMVAADGRIALVNTLAERLFGYGCEELIGESVEKLLPERFSGSNAADRVDFFAGPAMASGRDLFGLRKDGTEVPIEIGLNPIRTSEGQFVMASVIDITARNATEMELRHHAATQAAAAELSELALLEGDLSHVFNRAVELLAETLAIECVGVLELMPEGNALRLKAGIGWEPGSIGHATVPADLNGQHGYTLLASKPLGSGKARVYEAVIVEDIHAETRFKPVPLLLKHRIISGMSIAIAHVNRPYGILVAYSQCRRSFRQHDAAFLETIANILGEALQRHAAETELREAKAQLARTNEHLEKMIEERTAHLNESIRSLERICYNIAHDLRAPNRTMQGFAQALLTDHEKSFEGKAKDYLQRIATAAARNDILIRDLLAYGRLGHVDLPCSRQALKIHVDAVLQQLGEEISSRKASVKIQEPLADVWANPTALDQVLTNLLSNALKFVAKGVRPHVTIWTEPSNGNVRVFVQDNGLGIPIEHQQKVFGIFERLQSSYPGTGIGLAIVQKSVERMGGKVGVESTPNKGSCFWFDLCKVPNE